MLPDQAVSWVTGVIGAGSRVAWTRRLCRGSWHVNHAMDVIDSRGRTHRVVLRRWARPGWEDDDPDYTVEREVRVLGLLRPAPVPAPEVIAADPAGAQCDVPAILLTRLSGHSPRPADISGENSCPQLAEALTQIHQAGGTAGRQLGTYRLYYDRAAAAPARWMPATPVWQAAAAAVRQPPPATTMTLIHRDYHPENTLWSRSRLTGVVDWTQGGCGPAVGDDAGNRPGPRAVAGPGPVAGGAGGPRPGQGHRGPGRGGRARRHRLQDIRDSIAARIAEAEREGWTGEADGLKVSLAATDAKIAEADGLAARRGTAADLGMPAYRDIAGRVTATETTAP